jgi:hypothetical protein
MIRARNQEISKASCIWSATVLTRLVDLQTGTSVPEINPTHNFMVVYIGLILSIFSRAVFVGYQM